MKIEIIQNEVPDMKKPKFTVDGILADKLDNYPLTSTLNKSFILALIGRAGSGKSHFLISMLQSSNLMKKIFENILIFIPPSSRSSIAGDFWSKNLPEENIYDELNYQNLSDAYQRCKDNAEEGYKSLIIFDDVQKNFKGDCEKMLLDIFNNRRHIRTSIILAIQSYKSLSKMARSAITNLIIFKVNKSQMSDIFEEQIETMKPIFEQVLNISFKMPHDFISIDTNTQRIFLNWNEILIK